MVRLLPSCHQSDIQILEKKCPNNRIKLVGANARKKNGEGQMRHKFNPNLTVLNLTAKNGLQTDHKFHIYLL